VQERTPGSKINQPFVGFDPSDKRVFAACARRHATSAFSRPAFLPASALTGA